MGRLRRKFLVERDGGLQRKGEGILSFLYHGNLYPTSRKRIASFDLTDGCTHSLCTNSRQLTYQKLIQNDLAPG